jgi:hypothetical protein
MQTIPGRDEGGRTLCSGYAAGLARRAYAPALALPSAAEPRRSATGRAALDFRCKDLGGQKGVRSVAPPGTLRFVPGDGPGPVQSEVLALISRSELRGAACQRPGST